MKSVCFVLSTCLQHDWSLGPPAVNSSPLPSKLLSSRSINIPPKSHTWERLCYLAGALNTVDRLHWWAPRVMIFRLDGGGGRTNFYAPSANSVIPRKNNFITAWTSQIRVVCTPQPSRIAIQDVLLRVSSTCVCQVNIKLQWAARFSWPRA